MITATFGLSGVLLGALIGFFSGQLQIKHNERMAKRKLFLEKFENLFRQISKYFDVHQKFYLGLKYDFGPMPNGEMEDEIKAVELVEIEMLINLYAPQLRGQYEKCTSAVGDFMRTAIDYRKIEEKDVQLTGKFTRTYEEVKHSFDNLKASVSELSKVYM